MQSPTYDALGTVGATRGRRNSSLRPSMQLEEVAPEETKIRDLEIQIGEVRRKGESVDALLDERKRTYESWIARLDRELEHAADNSTRDRIKHQRDRARSDYGGSGS